MSRMQLQAGGVFLDLYENDLPKVTLSIQDAKSFEATTAYTQQFRVPATTNNNQFFKTAFMVNGLDFDITAKHPAAILVDGNEFKRGEIRLQNVYINELNGKIDYGCVFIGELRDLVTNIDEARLCDLELLHLTHSFNIAAITSSWEAYPQTPSSNDDGLLSGSVIYPLVDFGNSYDEDGFVLEPRIAIGYPTAEGGSFDNSSYPMSYQRFRPMIKCKDIIDEIFSKAGYQYESDFFDSSLFRHLYVSAWGDDAEVTLSGNRLNASNAYGIWAESYYTLNTTATKHEFQISTTDQDAEGNFDVDANSFIAPLDGDYEFYLKTLVQNVAAASGLGSIDIQFERYVNGVLNSTNPASPLTLNFYGVQNDGVNIDYGPLTLTAGDEVTWKIVLSNPSNWSETRIRNGSYIQVEGDSAATINPAKGLSCNTTQLEFLKNIQTKFNLMFSPIKGRPYAFKIEPWNDFFASGDVMDWTDKIDKSKDVVITPLFTEQSSRIEFKDLEGTDYLSKLNVDQFQEPYGQLNVVNTNELLTGTKEVKTSFVSVPSTQIEGAENTDAVGGDNFIIPQLHTHEVVDISGTPILKHQPIVPRTRIYWWNGLKASGTTLVRDITWYIENESSVAESFDEVPMISQFNEWGDRNDSWQGLDTQTRDLSWQREGTYIQYDLADTTLGSSVYDLYWSSYINSLYDKNARKLTAYFLLDGDDITNFEFNDVIFVKDTYYYVQKIYNAVVGELRPTKVDLIKLPNYYPSTAGFKTIVNWEDEAVQWQNETTQWQESSSY